MPFSYRNPDNPYNSGEPGAGLWFDTSLTAVSLAYDLKNRGIIIALTPQTAGSSSSTHWWYDMETGGLWKMKFGSVNQEPFCLHSRVNYVAESASHSIVMWGGRNGYIYRLQNNVNADDSNTFDSYVWIGPIGDGSMWNETLIQELIGELGRNSGQVRWEIYVGDTPEEAFNGTVREAGIWQAGRNFNVHPRTRGMNHYLKLNSVDATGWAFERASIILKNAGRARV